MMGEEWVETSPEIIQYFNRNGLNGAKFFIYEGIKVAPFGESEAIEGSNHEQLGQRIHGTAEHLVDNRT